MDPFTEKELIDCLKAMSATLNNIDTRIQELTDAVREIAGVETEEDDSFNQDGDDATDDSEDDEVVEIRV